MSSIGILSVTITLLFASSIIFYSLKNGIGPCFTSKKVQKSLIAILPELEDKSIVDFGSGWGSLIFPIAKKFPSSTVKGIENSFVPFCFSKLIKHFFSFDNVNIYRENFYKTSLRNCDVLILYLFPGAMQKLESKVLEEMPSNSIVISHTFAFPTLQATKVYSCNDLYKTKIFIYSI
ncbi:MAG: class I SAM-dependent methyltransferase [Chlamydiales bacterium]|nr:class I SAM-dependent methyltransferase [Chlamydiales bacterium]